MAGAARFRAARSSAEALVERPDPRILDCGCGTGANLVMLAEFGRASGFDLSLPWARVCPRRTGSARVAQASITGIPFGGERFDLVTAFDVLYSLSEDQEAAALGEIFRVLKPGGTLIVNVAALRILRGNHSVFGAEVRRSTRRRLRRVLTQAGFRVTRLTYSNAFLFPLMLTVRTGQRLMGLATPEEAGTDVVLPPAPHQRTAQPAAARSRPAPYASSTCRSAVRFSASPGRTEASAAAPSIGSLARSVRTRKATA